MAGLRRLTGALLALGLAAGLSACTSAEATPEHPVGMSGTWTRLPEAPLSARHEAIAVWLADRFVVVGGRASPPCPASADCAAPEEPALQDGAAFAPESGKWTKIAPAPVPVSGYNAAVLDGVLYVLTGELWRGDSPVALLRYDPEADAWDRLPAPPIPYARLVSADCRLLGISPTDELQPSRDWIFDADTETWARLPDDPLGPSFDREAVWAGDSLLLTAKDLVPSPGSEVPAVVRFARLDLDSREWATLEDSDIIGGGPKVVGGLVVFPSTGTADGGEVNNWGRDVPFGGILDPANGAWSELPEPAPGGGLDGASLVVGNRVLVGGHLLDPRTGAWTLVPEPPSPDRSSAALAASDDTILVWGGSTATDNLSDGFLLQVAPSP